MTSVKRFIPAAMLCVLAATFPSEAAAEVLVDDVIRNVTVQDNAIRDETAQVVIHRDDGRGGDQMSAYRLYWKNLQGDKGVLGKMLLITLSPLDKRGEGFLLWQMERASDSQAWLYLPDLRQVRRLAISGHEQHQHDQDQRSDLGLGFEQIGTRLVGVNGENGEMVGRDVLGGVEYWVVETRSTMSNDPLPLRRFWISSADWTIAKIEYRDLVGRLARTQRIVWERIGHAWGWKRTEIQPADSPGKTIVELRDITVNTDLADRLFTVETLKSGRIP
ncbi:MAG: outer membrane lipoprotein-sorting protein [Nitrospirae bacterium]|nr:outer membrane lipoprotein-sorting protein [Nitrospirota bacterium]